MPTSTNCSNSSIRYRKDKSGPDGFPYRVDRGEKTLAWFSTESEAQHYTWMLMHEVTLSQIPPHKFMETLFDFLGRLQERMPTGSSDLEDEELEQL